MRILSLETSGFTGGVAALDGDTIVAEHVLDASTRSAQSLAPSIRGLLRELKWGPRELELIAVTSGPGSFTGLRVGVVTAKTLAYATGAHVAAINTLECIAAQAVAALNQENSAIETHVVMDAGREQFYAATFRVLLDAPPATIVPTRLVHYDRWLADLPLDAHVTGPGLSKVMDRLPPHVRKVDSGLWAPSAAEVGKLGWARYLAGYRDDPWTLAPNYFRPSAAEEQFAARHPGH